MEPGFGGWALAFVFLTILHSVSLLRTSHEGPAWREVPRCLARGFDRGPGIHITFSNDLDQESANGLRGKNGLYIFKRLKRVKIRIILRNT